MYKIKIEKFQGPLDLLLQLIEQRKMEITDLSISEVTDQYVAHMEKLIDRDPEELSDFLFLAARLLVLKSRAIIPTIDEEEDGDDLEKQLKIYKEFLEASKKLAELFKKENFSFSREKPPYEIKVEFSPAPNITMSNLKSAFMTVLKRLDPLVKLPRQMMVRTVSLQQKILDLKDFLNKAKKVGLNDLIKTAQNRTDIIMSFLAMLELVKQQQVKINQNKLFDDIYIEKI